MISYWLRHISCAASEDFSLWADLIDHTSSAAAEVVSLLLVIDDAFSTLRIIGTIFIATMISLVRACPIDASCSGRFRILHHRLEGFSALQRYHGNHDIAEAFSGGKTK